MGLRETEKVLTLHRVAGEDLTTLLGRDAEFRRVYSGQAEIDVRVDERRSVDDVARRRLRRVAVARRHRQQERGRCYGTLHADLVSPRNPWGPSTVRSLKPAGPQLA